LFRRLSAAYRKPKAAFVFLTPASTLKYKVAVQVKSSVSGSGFADSVSLAAGGDSAPEHKADVLIQVTPILEGVHINTPVLIDGDGVEGVDADLQLDTDVTDENGQVKGHYTTSDVRRKVTIHIDTGLTYGIAEAVVDQRWNDVTNGDQWVFDKTLPVDKPIDVQVKPKFQDGDKMVPVTGHYLKFVVQSVTVKDLGNDGTSEPIVKTITADEDPNGFLGQLFAIAPSDVMDGSDGVYKGTVTINHRPQYAVINLSFEAEDQEVSEPLTE